MRFGILGPIEARPDGDRLVPVGGPGLRALLGLLLLNAGKVVTTDRLIDGLYGAEPPSGATNALQAQVSRLRQHLGDLVVREPAGYRLAVDPDDVDACRFERLAAEGRRALDAGDPARAAGLLGTALALWRGPALADVPDAPFAPVQAARLEELRLSAAEDLAEAGLALGRHRDLLPELQERVAAHPLRERSRGQLMRALYAVGRPAEALTVFEDARRVLAGELGADPSAELSAIHLAVLRADPALAPAAPAVRPVPLTSLVGREAELERVGALLADARLVTLTGPGGTGKTRLAVEAAGRWPGEVCLVELAPLTDGADVPQAVLGALGLRESSVPAPGPGARPSPADPVARLVTALTLRPVLLVLDNCEHVVEDAARLADRLLAACPALRVLATGREALGITGERLCPVPPLRVPPPGSEPAVEDALAYPAVRLFAERAAAVRPGIVFGPGDVGHVLRICRALDGLPLALELAAARLRSLPLARIAARLGADDPEPEGDAPRFALLSRGSRTAQPRHRTLRAVVEWSWDLLDEPERALARRLTVFAGGATLEAAERVCGLPDTDGVLASLVDKSLVEVVDDRYRMLETIRAFCAERLAESGESEATRKAHFAYVLDLAATADPHLRGPDQVAWLRRLDGERDNLHAALRRAVRAGDVVPALRLVSAATGYWLLRGLRGEAAGPAAELLGRIGATPPDGLEEEYVLCACLAIWNGASARAGGLDGHLAEAVRLGHALPLPPRQPFLLILWAMITGPPERQARSTLTDQVGLLANDPWTRTLSRYGVACLTLFDGRLDEAESQISEALAESRETGDIWTRIMFLSSLADIADYRGDHGRVETLVNEALGLAERLGATTDMAEALCRRAGARMRAGDPAAARADYEHAADLARRMGAPEMLALAHLGLGDLARRGGDVAGARRLYETALAECTADWFTAEETRSRIYVALGWAAEMSGAAAEALAWHRRALMTGLGDRSPAMAAGLAEGIAGVSLLEGNAERAAWLLGVGAALRGAPAVADPDVARVAARCRAALGGDPFDRAYAQGRAYVQERMPVGGGTAAPALTVIEGHLSALGG
ncbi:BTAD domain-containing putative transcriptional regulator [Microbispora sp. H11081]|uniref:BTAD domain-containing putative transcriptional regulator n=1 Tax=Microbispora sp. H11081 TaxID=2729107 RepID=UPI0014740D82|nr:BTAD domain-containing putative transcriptional regulator [Microbispora sp. H11081]